MNKRQRKKAMKKDQAILENAMDVLGGRPSRKLPRLTWREKAYIEREAERTKPTSN